MMKEGTATALKLKMILPINFTLGLRGEKNIQQFRYSYGQIADES